MSTALATKTVPLTAQDRCDRCGAQAKVRAILTAGELLFCGHHGKAHLDALVMVAQDVHDEGIVR